MEDIICPNCKKVFKVDEAGFADILRQVRNHQFNKELQERLEIANREKDGAVKLAESYLLPDRQRRTNSELILRSYVSITIN